MATIRNASDNPRRPTTIPSLPPMVRLLDRILTIGVLFVDPNLDWISTIYDLIMYTVCVYNCTVAVYSTFHDDGIHTFENLFMITSALAGLGVVFDRKHKIDFLRYLRDDLLERCSNSPQYAYLSAAITRGKLEQAFSLAVAIICVIVSVPLYSALFANAPLDGYQVLVYPTRYPWRRDTICKYLAAMITQYIGLFAGYALLLFGLGSLYVVVVCIHVRRVLLQRRLMDVEERFLRESTRHAIVLRTEFVSIIREHRRLIRFVRQSIRCLVFTATVVLTWAICIAILLVSLMFEKNLGLLFKLKYFSLSSSAILSLFICCYTGDYLLHVNAHIQNTIYDMSWHVYPIQIRKLIIVMMIQNQRQFQIKSHGLFLLVYVSYIAMLKDGYFLRLLRVLLIPGGIFVQNSHQTYRLSYTVGFVSFVFGGLCGIFRALFMTRITKMQILETLFAFNIALNILEIFAIEQYLRRKLIEIYAEIRDRYISDNLFAQLSDKYSLESVNQYKWILLWIYLCTQAPPLVIIFTSDINVGDLRALNFPSWYPWNIDTTGKYLLTITIQTLCTAIANAVMYAAIGILFCFLVAVRSQYEIFVNDLRACFAAPSTVHTRSRFVRVIDKHRTLMKFTEKIVDVSSYLAVLITSMFVVTVIMLASIIIQAPYDYLFNSKLLCSTITLTTIFFWCCQVGEVLHTLTDQILNAIFESQWYTQQVEIQKMVLLFQIYNQKQFKLKIFNLYWIRLNFFINVLRTCYSIIQIVIA